MKHPARIVLKETNGKNERAEIIEFLKAAKTEFMIGTSFELRIMRAPRRDSLKAQDMKKI